MAIDSKNAWLKEFDEFLAFDPEETQGSGLVLESVSIGLRQKLFPNHWLAFGKVFAIHIVMGFLSLTVCNQFGLNPFNTYQTLTEWFMELGGHSFCMLACGVFFMASTGVLSNLILSLEELEAVKNHEWLQSGLLIMISLSSFYFFGAEFVGTFIGLWIFGAVLGAILSIEGSFRLRRSWA